VSRSALVVEDDEALSEVEALVLRQMGYAPTTMLDGQGAAQWVREHRPDVVLLDLMLPGRSGYDICQELKLDRETNLIPIIIATARTQHEDVLHGLRVGANQYLIKPFTLDQLEHAVEHVTAWRRAMEESGAHGEIHFTLQSDTQYLEELNDLLSSLFLYTPLSREQIFELTTAVREMGSNAIEWGNRRQVERPVTVTYRIDAEKVEIVIRDQGSGFNRCDLAHACCGGDDDPAAHLPVREAKGLRVGGFGIFMTRGLVDEMEYNEAGNEVRLVKRFARSLA
jgi:two-component system OmpR family response regulator